MATSNTVKSYQHKKDKRAYIPSKEEEGMEAANDGAKKASTDYPLNPVTTRGKDPELFWLNKYGQDDREELLKLDIRSLYRKEHISPELLVKQLYKMRNGSLHSEQMNLFEVFGNALEKDELDKVADYYQYSDDWKNRLIQGDSLLVMASLLEREGMAGKVQTIYIDPPYGIKYGSNWQMRLNSRDVKDGSDEHLSGEPEMIKAFRDTWELGVHSYLSYLRDRLLVARELLTESGSCFVQISDENVHLVRNVMDEVFGSENFVRIISYRTKSPLGTGMVPSTNDFLIWYSKNVTLIKFRRLFLKQSIADDSHMNQVMLTDGSYRLMSEDEQFNPTMLPTGARPFRFSTMSSSGFTPSCTFPFDYKGKSYKLNAGKSWRTNLIGMERLAKAGRLLPTNTYLNYVQYFDDFPFIELNNNWSDTHAKQGKEYVVQTADKVIQRCILMTTDPGDLILDPTCGSGTTAFVAEQWGRRWITIDTSRIALNIAKTRLMTATFPFYELYDKEGGDIHQGFLYKKVPHITLKCLANDEPADEETLYDQPEVDKKKLRVAGPFTVETLQSFEPVTPEDLDHPYEGGNEDAATFENRIFEHLKSAGVKNGIKNENAVFKRVERRSSAYLHAEGFYDDAGGKERKAYIHIGPKFGTVAKSAVNEAVKECRGMGDADWLIILGFSFDSDIANQNVTMSVGSFEVTKVRMHDDLMQEGLLKKDKKAASFVTIGEPDIQVLQEGANARIAIQGLDIYDPIKDEVKARNVQDIAYWMVDDDYDGSNFIVKQVFFCGGDKDEFDKWKKGLSDLAKSKTKAKAEHTLRVEIDDEAFDRLYGFESHPIIVEKGKKVAVRVVSQFGEESTKVVVLSTN